MHVRLLLCCVATHAKPLVLGDVGPHEYTRRLTEVCCDTIAVTLTGAAALSKQSGRVGTYTVLAGRTQDGRAVYQQQQGGSDYLYYWSASSDWKVGSDYTTRSAGLTSRSDRASHCPEDAGTWKYYGASGWKSDGVDVTCNMSPWPPNLAPLPPPAPPPWPPGLAPRLPPPLWPPPRECDTRAEDSLFIMACASALSFLIQILFVSGARPRLLLALTLLPVLMFAASVVLLLYAILEWGACYVDLAITSTSMIAICAAPACFHCHKSIQRYREKLALIEGDLPTRLKDGSLRLLRVEWLLEQPRDWVLQRRQVMLRRKEEKGKEEEEDEEKGYEGAFWSPADALRLLKEGRVAALSYRWLGATQNDPDRFHLNAVLDYYGEKSSQRVKRHPAILIDFASLPQVEPDSITDDKPWGTRKKKDEEVFKKGLAVMSNMYASPRVLVLQHKRMPPNLEAELDKHGGVPPDDRPDLRPYAGEHCRSGWCTSETACTLLLTEGGGHAYELGIGPVPVRGGVLPSFWQMAKLFYHESTRFGNPKDQEGVTKSYLELREKVVAFEDAKGTLVRNADDRLSGEDVSAAKKRRQVLFLLLLTGGIGPIAGLIFLSRPGSIVNFVIMCLAFHVIIWAVFVLPSRILRAHLAALLCCRPRDSLEYSFHCSLTQPPFRRRPRPVSGRKWQDVSKLYELSFANPALAEALKEKTEFTNAALAVALKEKTELNGKEWEAFGITGLRLDHFIKSDNSYYMPFEVPEGFLPKKDGALVARRGLRATVSPIVN